MSEVETSHDVVEEEIHFREDVPIVENSTPPTPITSNDMDVIIKGWEMKFEQISRCLREVQLASEEASSEMFRMTKDGRARENLQERRIEAMHVGITEFLERCDPAYLAASRPLDAPTVSTPYTPSTPTGVPSRLRPDFDFQPSPVSQDKSTEPARSTNSRIRDRNDTRDTHTRDHDDARDTRTRDHDDIRDTRIREHNDARDTHIRDHHDNRDLRDHDLHDARDRSRDHRSIERPTHEDDRGDSGDRQRNSYHSGMSTSMSRPSSSPKVPTFDGTVSAQFRPWIIQFEAIVRHQCWTLGERVVRLVSSLTGPAANLLIGMTMGQLDDYNFLLARLSRRYDPPEREEAHRAELRARTRRRNESADEFAENLKNLAQHTCTSADQNMIDNLVVERFREGHGNEELKKHLCLYPSTGLQACVRFETHVEIGSLAHKSNEGLYTVQGSNQTELTLDEVTRTARKLGFTLRPWIDRQQNNRGFNNAATSRNQNRGEQQQSPKFNQNGNSGARQQNPNRRQTPLGEIKCWTCGKTGHYDCKSSGPKFAFAPKAIKMNFLQEIADQVNEYSVGEQNISEGNEYILV